MSPEKTGEGHCWNFCAKDWERKQWAKLDDCITD